MGGLLLREPVRRQPQQVLPIDSINPITRGLVHAWDLNVFGPLAVFDGAGRANGAFGSGSSGNPSGNSWQVGPDGYFLNFDDTGTGSGSSVVLKIGDASGSGSPASNVFTIAARIRVATVGSANQAVYGSGLDGVEFRVNGTGKLELLKQQRVSIGTSTTTVPIGVDANVEVTFDAGGTATFYINEVFAGSVTNSQTFSLSQQFYLGNAINTTGDNERLTNGSRIYRVHVWNRVLSVGEIRAWASNPFLIYRGAARELIATNTSRAYSLIAAAGAFAMSSASAGLVAARRLPAAVASFAVSAVAAGLIASRRLPGAPGAFAITGGATGLLANRRLAAGAGSFALSGAVAKLVSSRRMSAAAGGFVLSSVSVQLTYAPAQGAKPATYSLGAAPGSFALAGVAAAIRFNRRLSAAPSSFGMTVSAAAIRVARRLRGDSGAFAIAGSAAVLKYSGKPGLIDISKIPAARVTVFEGSGSRIVVFEGSGSRLRIDQMNVSVKLPIKVGDKWVVDRDPDEKSHYGADITQELIDRATTAVSVVLVLVGAAQLEDPQIQVVTVDSVQRTYVVAFLGGLDVDPPEGWKWVARVTCANKEQFDKTTWFNKVDP